MLSVRNAKTPVRSLVKIMRVVGGVWKGCAVRDRNVANGIMQITYITVDSLSLMSVAW